MIGATLSHFKVTAKLGEGGMGEVYRAEDTKLGREVAIKVLPADLAADPVRLERFAREAKAVAALDHPNIVTVHEIEQADGIHFIAMQLVEGKTLAQVIPAGGMALEQIFATAIPLADALSAAHEAGVVHRDLKPGNIMVGSDGRVRILDFGLAKLQADPSQPGSTQLGTEMLTTEGQIIGTVAYMSPEQAEGRVTDSRTDIFSLGVLLYQMATGRLPFRGETQISTITGIIRDSPTPITQLREELPWHLGRIVKRALDKDPERRYQSAKDLRNDLENLRAEVASGELSAGGERMMAAAAAATEAARESSRGIGGWAVAAALLLAALAGGYLLGHSSAGSEGRATPSTGLELKQVSYSAGFESWPSLTPDGEWAVYGGREAGDLDVYLQSVGGYKPINLTEDSRFDDYEPALSPDGQRIAFRSERQGGGIFVMQRTGESVRRVAAIGYSPAWSPDGRSLVIATEHIPGMPYSRATLSQLWRLDLDSAEQSLLTEGDAVEPRWSPNGARIVFWGLQRNSGQRDLFTIPVAGGDPQPLTNDPATDWSPAWAPDGRSIYFASDRSGAMNMWRIPVDESSGEALGPPEQITSGGAAWSVRPFFSQNGRRMAFSEGRWRYDVYRLPLDPQTGRAQGAMELVLGGPRNTLFPAVSPDGQRLAFSTSVGQQEDLFVVRLDGTGLTQLTDDLAKDRGARWSPSGDRLAFYSDRSGTYGIWLVNADGSGLQPVGVSTSLPADRPLWSPDGTRLAYVVRDELANKSTTLVLDLSRPVGEDNPRALPALPADRMIFNPSAWSADGDRLLGAFVSPSGGLAEIACYSLTAEEYRISNHQGEYPMWLGDGRRAIFFALDTLYLLDTSSDEIVELASVAPGTVGDYPSVSTDDRWFYFTLQTPEFDVWIADLGREN